VSMRCRNSIALVKFANRPDSEQYVVVGTVKELTLHSRSHAGGSIIVYKLSPAGDQLELVHRTSVEDIPGALVPFQGRLLAGIGKHLRIYDLGKKKLLRKCENKVSSHC
jgi:splicing factor 3B subunit 3